MISTVQLRMAKAALGWVNGDLAKHAGVSKGSIVRADSGSASRGMMALLEKTLETAGVEFGEDGWVRLRPSESE